MLFCFLFIYIYTHIQSAFIDTKNHPSISLSLFFAPCLHRALLGHQPSAIFDAAHQDSGAEGTGTQVTDLLLKCRWTHDDPWLSWHGLAPKIYRKHRET